MYLEVSPRFHPFDRRRQQHHSRACRCGLPHQKAAFDDMDLLSLLPLMMIDKQHDSRRHAPKCKTLDGRSVDAAKLDAPEQPPAMSSPIEEQLETSSVAGSGCAGSQADGDDAWRIQLDVKYFQPDELKVRLSEGQLYVDGAHEERETGDGGAVTRCFTRRYPVPDRVDTDLMTCDYKTVDANKVLVISAPDKPTTAPAEDLDAGAQAIPIERKAKQEKISTTVIE